MTIETEATPRPWTAERDDAEDGSIYYAIHAANYEFITNVEDKKLAALIVRAVNSLDALVEAGKAFVDRAEEAASEPGGAAMRDAPEWKLVIDMMSALALASGEGK